MSVCKPHWYSRARHCTHDDKQTRHNPLCRVSTKTVTVFRRWCCRCGQKRAYCYPYDGGDDLTRMTVPFEAGSDPRAGDGTGAGEGKPK